MPAGAVDCNYDKADDCKKDTTCYWVSAYVGCNSCGAGYQTDGNASAMMSCYKWQTSTIDGVKRQKCYQKSDGSGCAPNALSCSDDVCNFECADTHHRDGNSCVHNKRDCTNGNQVTNSATCTETWDPENKEYNRTDFTCMDGYLKWDNECKEHEDITCQDYLDKFYSNVAAQCTDGFKIQGNLSTRADDNTPDSSDCACKSDIKADFKISNTTVGACYQIKYFSNRNWGSLSYTDCICNPYYCPDDRKVKCMIPPAGKYWESDQTCKSCPTGTTTNFGTNAANYNKNSRRMDKEKACYISKDTVFCDDVGCFSLDDIKANTVHYK